MISRINTSRILLTGLFALCITFCYGQQVEPDFVVYYVQGNVKKINVKQHLILKEGDKLSGSDMISIAAKSRVFLICKNKNIIKREKPDTLRLNSLDNQCSNVKTSFTKAYFEYMKEELTGTKPDQQSYLHNIGAVKRSRGAPVTLWIDTINYSSGNLKIKLNENGEKLRLRVFDSPTDGKMVLSMNINGEGFDLDSLGSRLKSPGIYYWSVAGEHNRHYFKLWDAGEYRSAVESILKTAVQTDEAETDFMKGFLMEKNGFLTDASRFYKLAHDLKPDNVIYQKAYSRFL